MLHGSAARDYGHSVFFIQKRIFAKDSRVKLDHGNGDRKIIFCQAKVFRVGIKRDLHGALVRFIIIREGCIVGSGQRNEIGGYGIFFLPGVSMVPLVLFFDPSSVPLEATTIGEGTVISISTVALSSGGRNRETIPGADGFVQTPDDGLIFVG